MPGTARVGPYFPTRTSAMPLLSRLIVHLYAINHSEVQGNNFANAVCENAFLQVPDFMASFYLVFQHETLQLSHAGYYPAGCSAACPLRLH